MFKASFKYYKSKNPLPCLEEVLDMNLSEELLKESKIKKLSIYSEDEDQRLFGLKAPKEWEIFQLTYHPGLVFVKNPFTSFAQRYWTIRCLRDYAKNPNKMNIDSNCLSDDSNFWERAQNDRNILMSLRWTTLGYHHNWDTKLYNENEKGEFPEDLKNMTEYIASQMGYKNFVAEAAIVNYYQMNSTLSGHTDHSEQNLDAPLISISFGQSAIFLIGGKTLEEKPTPLFVRSGDIIIMSRDSRLSYHAVPKIMQTDSKPWEMTNECTWESNNDTFPFPIDEITWKPFGEYLDHSRININVRQVV